MASHQRSASTTRAAALAWGAVGVIVATIVGLAAGVGSPVATSPATQQFFPAGTPSPEPTMPPGQIQENSVDTWLVVLLRVVIVAFFLAVLIAIVVAVVRFVRGRRRRSLITRRVLEPDEMEMLWIPLPEGVYVPPIPAIGDAMSQSRAALVEGSDARAAIIAAWLRLEQAAEDSGVRPRPTDTPTDLVHRLVAHSAVATRHLGTLAEVYRRARFAPEEPDERDRAVALDALDAVHRSLGTARQDVGRGGAL